MAFDKTVRSSGLSSTEVLLLGFLAAIAVGTLLLSLPFATADGVRAPFMTALFTSASTVCVTGMTLVDTFSYWSTAGQVVILILMQLGGLGIIAFTTSVMLIVGRRVTLRGSLLLESAFSLNTLSGLVDFLKRMLHGTAVIEGAGFLCLLPVFLRRDGAEGIFKALFLSVSAFCNAGLDTIGGDSLTEFAGNVWVNAVIMALVVIGGLGFIVWWDVLRAVREGIRDRLPLSRCVGRLSLHSKLVLSVSGILIAGGALLILAFEFNNPETLGSMPFFGKLQAALFQSVTLRTAGFYTFPQEGLRGATIILSIALMFTGGSTCSTAGGVSTTAVAIIALLAVSAARGVERTTVFRRTIPQSIVRKALGVVIVSVFALLTAMAALSIASGGDFADVIFEASSAISTTGMTRGLTRTFGTGGQLILILCMYLGRVGPISLAVAFGAKHRNRSLPYGSEDVFVG